MKMRLIRQGRRALTLVELLMGASILSGLVVGLYGAFHAALLTYDKIENAAGRQEAAMMLLSRMETDLRNAFIFSGNDSGFRGGPASFEFFTRRSSFDEGAAGLRPHVAYAKYDVMLPVLRYSAYDDVQALTRSTPRICDEMSSSLESVVLRYGRVISGADGKSYSWSDVWPPEETKKPSLPAVVSIEVNFAKVARRQEAQESFKARRMIVLPLAGCA